MNSLKKIFYLAAVLILAIVFASFASADPGMPLEGALICVDPGHGGQGYSKSYTGGTRGVNSRMYEGDLNMKVAIQLVPMLTAAGADVTYLDIQSTWGHDAFLLEVDTMTKLIGSFLQRLVREEEIELPLEPQSLPEAVTL